MQPAGYLVSPHVAHAAIWVWDPYYRLCLNAFQGCVQDFYSFGKTGILFTCMVVIIAVLLTYWNWRPFWLPENTQMTSKNLVCDNKKFHLSISMCCFCNSVWNITQSVQGKLQQNFHQCACMSQAEMFNSTMELVTRLVLTQSGDVWHWQGLMKYEPKCNNLFKWLTQFSNHIR